jgi:hypothetical protein
MTETMLPDERVFHDHVRGGSFQSGVDRKRWRLIEIQWPLAWIAVSAAPREKGPDEYVFCFDLANYPAQAPTARPWDPEGKCPLAAGRWPGGSGRVAAVFKPGWKDGTCLYLPCDRISMEGHTGWPTQYPHLVWKFTSNITLYLEALHELLNSSDYSGHCSA